MTVKESLHALIDGLSDAELHAARRFLEYLRDRSAEGVVPCPECGALEHKPNEETIRALEESRAGIGLVRADDLDDLFKKLRA